MALGGLPDIPPGEDPPAAPSSATPQELEAHPGLARLLRNLGGVLGGDGLSPPLQRELHQAEGALARARRLWLHLELLWRLLGELIRDPRDLEPAVLRELELELELRRGAPGTVRPSRLLPALLPELQRRLREKREALRDFLLGAPETPQGHPETPQGHPKNPQSHPETPQSHPETPQGHPQNPRNAPKPPERPQIPRGVAELLRARRRRLRRERSRERLLRERLDGAGCSCAQVLSRCLCQLRRCGQRGALQAELDAGRGRFLLAKGGAMLLKSRLEELRVLLDTYRGPALQAHRRIREGLLERRRAAEAEAAILGAELACLRGLGPEFRQLALELGQIRQESAQKRWALRQLRPPPP